MESGGVYGGDVSKNQARHFKPVSRNGNESADLERWNTLRTVYENTVC